MTRPRWLTVPPFRALIFDIDGTLYDQRRVRACMLLRLLRNAAINPLTAVRTLRVLQSYRRAQEVLRHRDFDADTVPIDLTSEQIRVACELSGASRQEVTAATARWMETVPLDLIGRARYVGLIELLESARERGIGLAVCSDYPAAAKLDALGIRRFFDVIVTAQDPEVGRFKPHPRSIEIALHRLNISPNDALFVGDRPDVDGVAATMAGVPVIMVPDYHAFREQYFR